MRKVGLIIALLSVMMVWAEEQMAPIRVGLLLPLQAEVTQRDKYMNRFVDFYTGCLLAVYKMQATGQQVEVYTYDVGKSVGPLEQVLRSGQLDSMDMIIGPAYQSQVRVMAKWSEQHRVRTLLPFAYEVPELANNTYLFQFNPSEQADAEAIVNHLAVGEKAVRFVFVQAEESVIPTSVKELFHCVQNDGMEYVYTTVEQIMADSLWEVLSDSAENILVMNTERYANLRQVMPNIERAAQGKELRLVTRYAWMDEPIILPQIYTTMFREVDIDSTSYGRLYRRFVTKEWMPSRPCYDVLGYDIMTYVLESVAALQESDEEADGMWCRRFTGLQSNIHFVRVGEGGYQNKSIDVIQTK